MICDHCHYDEYFENCPDCRMTKEQILAETALAAADERLARSLAAGWTLPALYEHQANWANSGNAREIAIAARAIEVSIAG